MKEVTIVGYCDGDHDQRMRSAVERVLTVDGSKPVTLDLCDECDGSIRDLLVLMESGSVVTGKRQRKSRAATPPARPVGVTAPPRGGPHICPECQFESASRGALGQHLLHTHQKGFRDYSAA